MLNAEMVKSIQFLGAIALFGGAFFSRAVWAPAVQALDCSEPLADRSPQANVRLMAVLGASALLLFGMLDLVRFARVAADQPLATAGWQMLADVSYGTRYGRMLLLRGGIALGAMALLAWQTERRPIRDVLLALLGGVALISFSLASHAAATPTHGSWPLLADVAHMLAVGAWVGGLVPLALAPWRPLMELESGRRLLRHVTARFSALGLVSVVILAGTGIYMSSLRIYGPRALVETDYGIALLVKLLLVGALITVAAANRLTFLPGLRSAGKRSRTAADWLSGLIRVEVALAVFAVGFAADLTILSPAEDPPVRVTITMTESGFEPSDLTLPLGRTVLLRLENQTDKQASLLVRDFEHRLTRGQGAFRHREMLTFAPPTDRFGLHAAPGRRAVAEFTPLAEGTFAVEGRTQGSEDGMPSGQITVQGTEVARP